jgi:hypothetical protein
MKVTIRGFGGAMAADTVVDWPFPWPPEPDMDVEWTDAHANRRDGAISTVTYEIDNGTATITVAIK